MILKNDAAFFNKSAVRNNENSVVDAAAADAVTVVVDAPISAVAVVVDAVTVVVAVSLPHLRSV